VKRGGGTARLIVGDGVAGMAAAIRIAAQGETPIVIGRDAGRCIGGKFARDRSRRDDGWLEVIHGGAVRVLRDLELAGALASAPRCAGVWSRWASDGFVFRPSILDPFGAGAIVDRVALLAALEARACEAGIRIVRARDGGCGSGADIIATGRSALRGAPCRQVAMAVRCAGLRLGATDTLVVDAQPDGWWYAMESLGSAIVCFVTDAATLRRGAGARGCWRSAVDRCDWLPTELGERTPMVRHATSGPAGARRDAGGPLRVGDAAYASDPLSGDGLRFALASAVEAAAALRDAEPMRYRRWAASTAAARSSAGREVLSKVRFADQPYWQRRIAG
jgi:2-polyprenyl-6-methoxyphenol hydroxylase-like FAD-dependent oxidoreductase